MKISTDQLLADRLRSAILDGRLKPGSRLPPTRHAAIEHGTSRQSVIVAYETLIADGLAVARVGAGTYVAALPESRPAAEPAPLPTGPLPSAHLLDIPLSIGSRIPRPLTPGIPALDRFPTAAWGRLTAAVWRSTPAARLGYGDPQGDERLRAAIAQHLQTARGLAVTPEQIVVTAGSQQAIGLTAMVLLPPGASVWVEEPGYPAGRGALVAAGFRAIPVPIDDAGFDPPRALALDPTARAVLISPSHHYPTGITTSLDRRLALIDWSVGTGGWIIEDDYDGEFRHGGRPLPPLAALPGAERVVHIGTFSKTLAPALRLGFLVAPPGTATLFARARALADRGAGPVEQTVLADFIESGAYGRHLARMRRLYAERRRALLNALATEAAGLLDPIPSHAGLSLAARLPTGVDDRVVAAGADAERLGCLPLSAYHAGRPQWSGLLLGFANTPAERMPDAITRLARVIRAETT